MWVKFQKGHPSFSYFVGDVVDLSKQLMRDHKLNEGGYTIPAEEDEIAAAKQVIENENTRPFPNVVDPLAMEQVILKQQEQIEILTALLSPEPAATK